VAAIALDADVVIGVLHARDPHHAEAVALLRAHDRDHRFVIGACAYAECLVSAVRRGEEWRVDGMLGDAGVELVPVDRTIARRAADLRARHRSLRLPDAFSLATALVREAELLTFDRGLRRVARAERA
jgi:predicted nucleic acid-binding protein